MIEGRGLSADAVILDEWRAGEESKLLDAITYTASEMREKYKMPADSRIDITLPFNIAKRAEFERDERELATIARFDWSLWPIELRPGKRMTSAEARVICDHINTKFTAARFKQVAWAGHALV